MTNSCNQEFTTPPLTLNLPSTNRNRTATERLNPTAGTVLQLRRANHQVEIPNSWRRTIRYSATFSFKLHAAATSAFVSIRPRISSKGTYIGTISDVIGTQSSLAQSFVKSIKEDPLFLYQTILASGPALLKRWRTGEARRKEYLTKAQPDIYPYSQPLIAIAYRGKTLAEAWMLRVAYLLPYVNIEDLGKGSANFIPLLHYRTKFPPEDWFSFDNAQLQLSWKQGCYCEKLAEGCMVTQGEQYGHGEYSVV